MRNNYGELAPPPHKEIMEITVSGILGGAKEKSHLRLSRWQWYWQGEQSCALAMCRLVGTWVYVKTYSQYGLPTLQGQEIAAHRMP